MAFARQLETLRIRHAGAAATRCILIAFVLHLIQLPFDSSTFGQQPFSEDRALPTAASLPESPEALLLSGRAQTAILAGDYRIAIDLIRQLGALSDGLVAAPASRTFYTVRGEARRLLSRLPEAGIQLYRQMYDAEVAARFELARNNADLAELRVLFESFPLCTDWPRIGGELVARLLDDGHYTEALEILEQLGATGPGGDEKTRTMAIVGLGELGAWSEAERVLDALRVHARLPGREAAADRVQRLEKWLERHRTGARAGRGQLLQPMVATPVHWTQDLTNADAPDAGREAELATAISDLRRFPLQAPLIADEMLLVRVGGSLWALDALTLTPVWKTRERAVDAGRIVEMLRSEPSEHSPAEQLSAETRALLGSELRHSIGAGFGLVLSIEEQTGPDDEEVILSRRAVRSFSDPLVRNELVARRTDSGDIVWRAGDDPAGALYNIAFQDRPLAIGDGLVVPIRRGDEVRLVTLDPNDGTVVRETPIVGPPTHFTRQGGRVQIEADETTLYVCTGNGVVAALERDSQKWKWATVYPNTLIQHMGRFWWRTDNQVTELSMERPLLAGDALVVGPIDALEFMALDRVTGREQWRLPRREYRHLIGVVRAGLIVAGAELTCLDLGDPVARPPRWRSVPLGLVGRPVICEERIYAPTKSGIVIIDGASGKVIADEARPVAGRPAAAPGILRTAEMIGANLIAGADGIYAVSSGRVRKCPDAEAVRRRCAALQNTPEAARATLALAWIDLAVRDYRAAIDRLERLDDAPLWHPVRENILTQSYLAMAESATDRAERLDWLHRAAERAGGPEVLARLGFTIARALEEAGEYGRAAEKYAELILHDPGTLVVDAERTGHSQAAWLTAAQALELLLDQRDTETRSRIVASLLQQADNALPAALLHLCAAIPAGTAQEPLRHKIAGLKLAPELAIHYLPQDDDARLPLESRAALWLRRWEVHAALGQVEAAQQDRDYWQKQFGTIGGNSTDAAAEILVERAEAIGLALKKQEQSAGTPYSERIAPQWRIDQAELLFEPNRPLDFSGRYLLVRNWEQRKIQLIDAWKHQGAVRVHDDGLSADAIRRPIAARESPDDPLRHLGTGEESTRPAWPVLRHEALAVAPVSGGLVCLGLGPERGGGGRLWQAAVPEWPGIVVDFAERTALQDAGVCIAARRDRLQMLDWADGRVRWQRDLPGVQIERIMGVGGFVVVHADDGQLLTFRAADGNDGGHWSNEAESPRACLVSAGRLIVWTDDVLGAFQPATLKSDWTIVTEPVVDVQRVLGADWLAFRTHRSLEWQVIDLRTGQPAIAGGIGGWESLSAAGWDGQRLLVSGRQTEGNSDAAEPGKVEAFDAGGNRLWSCNADLHIPVNGSQLVSHPAFVPLLLSVNAGSPDREMLKYSIELVRRETGEHVERFEVDNFVGHEHLCEAMLLATPTRMIVQVRGNVLAYGNSALSVSP